MAKEGFFSRFLRKKEEEKRHSEMLPGVDDPPLPKPVDPIKNEGPAPKRNDPCPCGSGYKYKKCCGKDKEKKA